MINIPVYKIEQELGLAEKIRANSSIAYHSKLEPALDDVARALKKSAHHLDDKTLASATDNDLYPTRSVLVSTNWNKNDDVFDKREVWIARYTPIHKPTNLDHDEKVLVGHITDNWAIKDDGSLIAENTPVDDLPNLYHIVNGAVIYNNWQDDDLKERTSKLISEIQDGKRFVSMECLFNNFDYAVIGENENFYVVPRDKDTAHLTSHLRAYGGNGVFEGRKIGRLLRNITFCGKGYVYNPANPHSIVFSKNNLKNLGDAPTNLKSVFSLRNGVTINKNGSTKAEKKMSETITVDTSKEIQELKAELKEANKKLADANVKGFEKKIADLEEQIEARNGKMKEKDEEKKKMKADLDEAKSTIESLEKDKEDLTKSKEELEKQIASVEAEKLTQARISTLVDGGIEKEIATKKVELFEALNDEQFDSVASELIEAAKAKKQKAEASNESETAESEEEEEVLETVEASEDILTPSGEEGSEASELDKTRADIQEFLKSQKGK